MIKYCLTFKKVLDWQRICIQICICDIFIAKSPQFFTFLGTMFFVMWFAMPSSISQANFSLLAPVFLVIFFSKMLQKWWCASSKPKPQEAVHTLALSQNLPSCHVNKPELTCCVHPKWPHGRQPSCPSQSSPGPPKALWDSIVWELSKEEQSHLPIYSWPQTYLWAQKRSKKPPADPVFEW